LPEGGQPGGEGFAVSGAVGQAHRDPQFRRGAPGLVPGVAG
jgi:hypothetical protein